MRKIINFFKKLFGVKKEEVKPVEVSKPKPKRKPKVEKFEKFEEDFTKPKKKPRRKPRRKPSKGDGPSLKEVK